MNLHVLTAFYDDIENYLFIFMVVNVFFIFSIEG